MINTTEIMENVTIIYDDGLREQFDAIRLNGDRVIICRILKINGTKEFVETGIIPKNNIKNIIYDNQNKIIKKKS